MFLVSNVIDAVATILPPRWQFELLLRRIDRWQTFEHGYQLLPMLVDRQRAAIDVGANQGYYAGKLARYAPRVHCFEPLPWLADALEPKLPRNAILHRVAVSDHNGSAVLRIPMRADIVQHGTATIEPHNPLANADTVRTVTCDTVTLDTAFQEPIGFLKIDVEGHELAILAGAKNLIEREKPVVLIESERRHHPDAPEAVFTFFAERGYAGIVLLNNLLFSLNNFNTGTHQASERVGRAYANNFLFLPPLP